MRGQPRGYVTIIGAEAAERFAFYGMRSILVLYMTRAVLLPDHAAHAYGLAPLRRGIEFVLGGALSPVQLASAIFGLYSGFVYLAPLAGGALADRVLGRRRTILLGAVLAAAGHFLMAFEASFVPALLLLVAGVGLFKGNIAAQLGELYEAGDTRRADAYQVFQFAINTIVIVTPLVCGTLGERVAWRYGFLAASAAMLCAVAIYAFGMRGVVTRRAPDAAPAARRMDRRRALALAALLPGMMLAMVGNEEIYNAYLVWAGRALDMRVAGFAVPLSWLTSVDAVSSDVTLIAAIFFWRAVAARRGRAVGEPAKLVFGAVLMAAGVGALALGSAASGAAKVAIGVAVSFHMLLDFGYACFFPVGLALFSRVAPPSMAGLMVGVFYAQLFAADLGVGYLGGLLETMQAATFWTLHAALILTGAIWLFVFGAIFRKELAPPI